MTASGCLQSAQDGGAGTFHRTAAVLFRTCHGVRQGGRSSFRPAALPCSVGLPASRSDEHRLLVRRRDLLVAHLTEVGAALKVDHRETAVEPGREPPSAVTEHAHHCRHEDHPDERHVEEHRDREAHTGIVVTSLLRMNAPRTLRS